MKSRTLFFLSLLFTGTIFSSNAVLRIRIFTSTDIGSFSFLLNKGEYSICGDSARPFPVAAGISYSVKADKDSMLLKRNDTLIGKFALIRVTENAKEENWNGSLIIKIKEPVRPPRIYDDGLEISSQNNFIRILNTVDIEHYTCGVIQAEVGKMNPLEFDKVKAIIIRTYSLSNLRKHETENYHLCDQVHCQVYRGKSEVDNIVKAVEQTKGMVLVDTSIALVNASFFSNCGGQTCNSEDVWLKALPYLRSVKDTFCHAQPDAYWEKKIDERYWLGYFEKKFKYPVNDSSARKKILSFAQDERKIYLTETPVKIPLKVLRDDWKLKSTFFSVEEKDDVIILKGRGFGHGVGLCQEGAMRMAKLGYGYRQIIDFYYQDVTLIDLAKLEFFRDE